MRSTVKVIANARYILAPEVATYSFLHIEQWELRLRQLNQEMVSDVDLAVLQDEHLVDCLCCVQVTVHRNSRQS